MTTKNTAAQNFNQTPHLGAAPSALRGCGFRRSITPNQSDITLFAQAVTRFSLRIAFLSSRIHLPRLLRRRLQHRRLHFCRPRPLQRLQHKCIDRNVPPPRCHPDSLGLVNAAPHQNCCPRARRSQSAPAQNLIREPEGAQLREKPIVNFHHSERNLQHIGANRSPLFLRFHADACRFFDVAAYQQCSAIHRPLPSILHRTAPCWLERSVLHPGARAAVNVGDDLVL